MNWYEKLNMYFPVEEMKSKEHMELLFNDKGNLYHKDEGIHHVMIYAESDTFIFIDYLWVSSEARGKGIGRQLIEKLKKNKKPIILEVEQVDDEDQDTMKRLRFYSKIGFKHAQFITFKNHSFKTDKEAPLEILYWASEEVTEVFIYEQMKRIYQMIHCYSTVELYGKSLATVDEVLFYDENRTSDNLLYNY